MLRNTVMVSLSLSLSLLTVACEMVDAVDTDAAISLRDGTTEYGSGTFYGSTEDESTTVATDITAYDPGTTTGVPEDIDTSDIGYATGDSGTTGDTDTDTDTGEDPEGDDPDITVIRANLGLVVPDAHYNGSQATMTCVKVNVPDQIGFPFVDAVEVDVAMNHSWIADLTIKVFGPNGNTRVLLLNQPASNSDLATGYPIRFKHDGAKYSQSMGSTLTNGVVCKDDAACDYRPGNSPGRRLSAFIGTPAEGSWHVCFGDSVLGDIGVVQAIVLRIFTA